MGTKWHIALYSRQAITANRAFDAAWQIIEEIDKDLSNYSSDSELNQLCHSAPHKNPIKVGEHLWRVLVAADSLSRRTDGAFDVTIGPVSKLWRRARKLKRLPNEKDLEDAKAAVGFRFIELHPESQSVRLTRPKMQLDLGGIAKGYAVDRAVAAIRERGIDAVLVNGGGDLAVGTGPPHEDGWEVKLAGLNPAKEQRPVRLSDCAVATSGDAWQYIEINGKRYSHIIDPHTGLGTSQRISVSVVAPKCMVADSVASALCVLPTQKGQQLLATLDGVKAKLLQRVGDDQIVIESKGFPSR